MSGHVLPEAVLLEHVGYFEWPAVHQDDRITPLNHDDIVLFDELDDRREVL